MRYAHGTRACYVCDKCRCFRCKVANSDYEWRRYNGQLPDRWCRDLQPIRDHIAALRAAGYGTRTIADIAGISRQQIQHILGNSRGRDRPKPASRILQANADAILAVELPGDPGIDEIAVLRHMQGDHTPRLNRAERLELVARWRAAGYPLKELERRTGWNVFRYSREFAQQAS